MVATRGDIIRFLNYWRDCLRINESRLTKGVKRWLMTVTVQFLLAAREAEKWTPGHPNSTGREQDWRLLADVVRQLQTSKHGFVF